MVHGSRIGGVLYVAKQASSGSSPLQDALPTRVAVTFDSKFVLAGDERGKLLQWDGKQATLLAGATAAQPAKH